MTQFRQRGCATVALRVEAVIGVLPAIVATCFALGCGGRGSHGGQSADSGSRGAGDSSERAGGANSAAETATQPGTASADAAGRAAGGFVAPQPVVAVRTAVTSVQSFVITVSSIGAVAPRPGRYAELSAPAPTRVVRIFVAPGDAVDSGAPLVAFERAPFDAAAASAEAALSAAQHTAERTARLAAAGVAPRKDVDQAQAELAQAENVAVSAKLAQQRSTLRAPLAGVVTHVSAVLGAPVDPSQAVVGVADPTALDVVVSLPPADGAQVHVGARATFTAGQDAAGEPLGSGIVTAVAPTVDSASRGVVARAHMAHPTRTLRIGETVYSQIAVGVHHGAVTVPVQALVPDGEGLKVFVVEKDGLAHARRVAIGGRTERDAEITTGIAAGETIVTDGAYGVDDGAKVVPLGPPTRDRR